MRSNAKDGIVHFKESTITAATLCSKQIHLQHAVHGTKCIPPQFDRSGMLYLSLKKGIAYKSATQEAMPLAIQPGSCTASRRALDLRKKL